MGKDEISRRHFTKISAGGILLGIATISGVSVFLRLKPTWAQGEENVNGYDWEKHEWGFIVNTETCIGCGRCVVACKIENHVPMDHEVTRTWVERYVIDEEGEAYVDSPHGGINGFDDITQDEKYKDIHILQSFFVPKLCNHCENPPCVQVCPVGATYKTKDGVILVDKERCVGCRYCIQACPYGARYLHPEEQVADKCTWCYHRITKGLEPACVEVCPVGARCFGDLKDPEAKVRECIREDRMQVLKPELGTEPKVHYIGLTEEVK